ncbi:MAG: class II aldolase [Anaerolineales bacterium]|nr:class II aldolase [Anaerolineales bacterium]
MSDIRALLEISHYAGRDLLLAQGGGGNSSVKSADRTRLWIKASGLRLAQLREGFGYVELDLAALVALVRDPLLRAAPRATAHAEAVRRVQAAVFGDNSLRPSLETTFHALLGPVVLHTHPIYVNALTCLAGGQALLAEALGVLPTWVPYAAPGYALGVAVDQARAASGEPAPAAIYLANHGLVAAGETAEAVIAATKRAGALGKRVFGALAAEALETMAPPAGLAHWASELAMALQRLAGWPAGAAVRPTCYGALHGAATEPERWLAAGPLVPDDVVYNGRRVWVAPAQMPAARWLSAQPDAQGEAGRLVVAVAGRGVVVAAASEALAEAMEATLLAHVLIRRLVARRGTARPLAPEEVAYLAEMESERYRQAMVGTV